MLGGSHQNLCVSGPLTSRVHYTRPLAFRAPRSGISHSTNFISLQQRRTKVVRADSDERSGDGQASTAVEPEEALGNGEDATPSSANDVQQPEATVATSEEDIKKLKAALQKQRGEGAQDAGLVEGILEEVRLISWPNPLQALSDTLVVIAIVAGTAVSLFAVNTILSDIAKQIY